MPVADRGCALQALSYRLSFLGGGVANSSWMGSGNGRRPFGPRLLLRKLRVEDEATAQLTGLAGLLAPFR